MNLGNHPSLRSLFAAAALFAGLTQVACAGFGKPAVTPENPSIAGIGTRGLDIAVDLRVENPNPFAIVAGKVSGTLLLGEGKGKRVGTADVDLSKPIEAK